MACCEAMSPPALRRLRSCCCAWLLLAACATAAHKPGAEPNTRGSSEPPAAVPPQRAFSEPPVGYPWHAAAERFRATGQWMGADGAYSIDLGPSRVLWLFADTFIDPLADGSRENGPNQFIRNSVAIQSGPDEQSAHDLSQSTLSFHWGTSPAGTALSFFRDIDSPERWIWPLHGIALADGKLLLFRMQVVHTTSGFGFALDGWDAVAVDDPALPPETWRPRSIATKRQSFGKLVGSSVLQHESFVYAYAVENQAPSHTVFLARWGACALNGLGSGALDDPAWYTGRGFESERELTARGATPTPLFSDGQVEFSVHYDPEQGRFIQIQVAGLFLNDPKTRLAMRTAPRPEGPWSALQPFYRPAESALVNAEDLAAYAGKAHPEQRGGHVVTYVVNDVKRPTPADTIYYPQPLLVRYGTAAEGGESVPVEP